MVDDVIHYLSSQRAMCGFFSDAGRKAVSKN